MQELEGFETYFSNNVLYLKGNFEEKQIDNILCDNVRVLNDNVIIKHEYGIYKIIAKNGEIYYTNQITQNDKYVSFTDTNNLSIICKFETIIKETNQNYSFVSKNNLISLILEYNNKFSFEIKSSLNMYTNILSQVIILTSNLPYILKNIPNLRISFQGRENISQLQIHRTSSKMESSLNDNSSISDIGLPIDLGEIEELSPKSKLYLPLSKTQLTIIDEKFIYNLGEQYCILQRNVKVEKNNVYPSIVSICDENDLPFSNTNVSLYKADSTFTLNMGKYPAISFETKYTKDVVELTINSNMSKYPFILLVKGYDLEGDYEIKVKSKTTTQKLNRKIEKQ
jgi:hypothetical protein